MTDKVPFAFPSEIGMRLGQLVINLTVGFHYSVQKGQLQTLSWGEIWRNRGLAIVELCVKLQGHAICIIVVIKSLFFFVFKKGSVTLNRPRVP